MKQDLELAYFSRGRRPFHLQFPPWVAHLCASSDADVEGNLDSCWSRGVSGAEWQHELDEYNFVQAPQPLHSAFDCKDVQPWEPRRYELVGKMQDALRNNGQVECMRDVVGGKSVAVKTMPNNWICVTPEEFHKAAPHEIEQPWTDIGCTSFLNKTNYPYACTLFGVYRNLESTSVVTELATEGDFFDWSSPRCGPSPGLEREATILPVAKQLIDAIARLHDVSLVHHDLSLENILLSKSVPHDGLHLKLIDFGMSHTGRRFRHCVRGKPSYQAPEVHLDEEYDGFLAEAFAAGVILYTALMQDYPWLSTKPRGCKCFDYVRKHGFRAYVNKRKLRGTRHTMAHFMSEELVQLLEGLLAFDPAKRLTLGESVFAGSGRRSVLDESWLCSSG